MDVTMGNIRNFGRNERIIELISVNETHVENIKRNLGLYLVA